MAIYGKTPDSDCRSDSTSPSHQITKNTYYKLDRLTNVWPRSDLLHTNCSHDDQFHVPMTIAAVEVRQTHALNYALRLAPIMSTDPHPNV